MLALMPSLLSVISAQDKAFSFYCPVNLDAFTLFSISGELAEKARP